MCIFNICVYKNLIFSCLMLCISVITFIVVPDTYGQDKSLLKTTKSPGIIKPNSEPTIIRSRNLNALLSSGIYQDEPMIKYDGSPKDHFGHAVAISGETLVVGAPDDDYGADSMENQGSAYIFVRSATKWSIRQKITANDGELGDQFGSSVVISGNTIVIGAPNDDGGKGSVYVFEYSGTLWLQKQKLTASDRAEGDHFGSSIAVSGYTLVIGAPDTDSQTYEDIGVAYVFAYYGILIEGWIQKQKLLADDGYLKDHFGCAVAIEGNTLVVGAYYKRVTEPKSVHWTGAVYIFANESTWTQTQKIENPQFGVMFGRSVAISGETIAIGGEDAHGVWIYVKTRGSWILQQQLTGMNCSGDFFHLRVALYGDRLLVGSSSGYVDPTDCDNGLAYVFERSNGIWSLKQTLTHSEADSPNNFGLAVALNNTWIVIGAPRDDIIRYDVTERYSNPITYDRAGSVTIFEQITFVWPVTWSEKQLLTAEIYVKVPNNSPE